MARSHLSLLAGLAFTAIAGAQTTKTFTYPVGGTSRSFVAHVPSGISQPALVFFVHGYGGSGSGFENDTKGDAVADREKFIAVYPSAVGGSWSMYDTTDYPFLLSIVDTVDAHWKIDRRRVYCAGFSQGGFISHGLGYKHPGTFAAVAPVSGHMPSFSTTAPLPRAVPTFITFGTNDVSDVASFMADLAIWKRLDTCTSSPVQQRPYPSTRPKSVVSRTTWSCAHGSEVVIDSVIGGGHEWAMDTTSHVNTTEEVWAFFKRFTRDGTTSILPHPVGRETLRASWVGGALRLEGIGTHERVRILDARGKQVQAGWVEEGRLDCGPLAPGLYSARGSAGMATFVVP
jgi:polyhydroxybutyrate depolymerase